MPRRKKERGRPPKAKNLYPPRVDATAEEMARAMFGLPADHQWEYPGAGAEGPVYRCAGCRREVRFPEPLYRDGLCEPCHNAVPVS